MSVKVLLADDHEMVRTGVASLLAGSQVKIVAEACTANETVKMANKHKPDLVLLDLRFGGHDAFDVIEKLRRDHPKLRIVVLSTYDNPTYVARAAAAGANDYLLKGCSRGELLAVINGAAEGKSPVNAGEMQRILTSMTKAKAPTESDVPLTSRETQVLRNLALGLSNKEVAKALEISVETVKEHVQNILRKMQMVDRTQAAVWAVRRKLV